MRRLCQMLIVSSALAIGGCNPYTVGTAMSPLFVKTNHVNLLNASYAAADVLAVQTKQTLLKSTPLVVHDFEEIKHTQKSLDGKKEVVIRNTKLGLVMHDQIRSRFQQLGYNITDANARAAITGIYEVIGNDLAVRLRVKEVSTGKQLGQYDYWMPITSDLRKYMDPAGERGIPVYKVRESMDGIFIQ